MLVEQNIKLTLDIADDIVILNSGSVVFTRSAERDQDNNAIVTGISGCIDAWRTPPTRRVKALASLAGRNVGE